MTALDPKIVAAGVKVWLACNRHARCRFTHGNDRPSDKGRSAPIAANVDQLLQSHGITDIHEWTRYAQEISRQARSLI